MRLIVIALAFAAFVVIALYLLMQDEPVRHRENAPIVRRSAPSAGVRVAARMAPARTNPMAPSDGGGAAPSAAIEVHEIQGTVRRSSGRPLSRPAQIHATCALRPVETRAGGGFRMDAKPGACAVTAEGDGVEATVKLTIPLVGPAFVDLVLDDAARARLTLRIPSAPPGTQVLADCKGGHDRRLLDPSHVVQLEVPRALCYLFLVMEPLMEAGPVEIAQDVTLEPKWFAAVHEPQ